MLRTSARHCEVPRSNLILVISDLANYYCAQALAKTRARLKAVNHIFNSDKRSPSADGLALEFFGYFLFQDKKYRFASFKRRNNEAESRESGQEKIQQSSLR